MQWVSKWSWLFQGSLFLDASVEVFVGAEVSYRASGVGSRPGFGFSSAVSYPLA